MKHEESILQRNCVKWFRLQYPEYSKLLFAIPNGGKRNAREAAIMKAEGIVPGVADLMLAMPSANSHGLFIEMKTATGTQSKLQQEWQTQVVFAGYRYELVRTFDGFCKLITDYICTI